MDLNKIKGGRKWQLVATRWDERTSKVGEPFTYTRHRRGDIITLSEADARRLFAAGAIVEPGSIEKADAEAKVAAAALSLLPEEVRGTLTAEFLTGEPGKTPVASGAAEEVEQLRQELAAARAQLAAANGGNSGASAPKKPAKTAPEEAWREFAAAVATTDEDKAAVATMDRGALIAKYGA